MCKKNEKQELFFYLGFSYDIIFISTISNVDIDYDNRIIYAKDEKMLNKWYNKTIKDTFTKHYIDIFNKFEEVKVIPKLRIRKMKTRWGVCNKSSMTVTLNTTLIHKDVTLIDYVIIHELCHFKHMDHSPSFWKEVEKYYPYYKLARKRLK
jgi:predicted metal-dependent hydrolase